MPQVLLTHAAEEARIQIWQYLAEKSQSYEVADRFLDTIDEKCRLLATQPRIGEARPDLGKGVRHFPVGDYLVLYRPDDEGIVVLLVVHGSRDIPALWKSL